MVCDGGQALLVPDAVMSAAAEDNPLDQMNWLEGGFLDVADWTHECAGHRVIDIKRSEVSCRPVVVVHRVVLVGA